MDITKYYAKAGEKPLDTIKPDGGFSSIFRTIACIGDSLSSGEFESNDPETGAKGYHDMFEHSWGQYIARATGANVYNFSAGGMTANVYMGGWGEGMGCFDPEKTAHAYIVALGANDVINQKQPFGTADDINFDEPEKSAPTFAGYYGRILLRYKAMQPRARFFLITMPRESDDLTDENEQRRAAHAELLHSIAAKLDHTYVIDLNKYAPIYDAEFKRNFFLGGHMNAAGYRLTADMVMSYIDYIVRNSPEDFGEVGFIGTDLHNSEGKW